MSCKPDDRPPSRTAPPAQMDTRRRKMGRMRKRLNEGKTAPSARADEKPPTAPPPPFPYDLREAGYRLPPKPDSLCERCWDGPFGVHAAWLFDVSDASQETKSYSYVDTWEAIESRAEKGCVGCRFLQKHKQKSQGMGPADISITVGLRNDRATRLPTGMHMLAVDVHADERVDEYSLPLQFYAYALDDDHPSAPYTTMHTPILDIGSRRAFAAARDLLRKCEAEHERCRRIVSAPQAARLPRRLIDCTNPCRPRLVESGEGECGRYAALSYVWGGDQPHKTTQTNIGRYERRIPLRCLPRTIRDAIRAAHELGFTRLWVDSLCIVQDADEEKVHEIGRMHHIYRHAALTIVAARARHAGEGFLRICDSEWALLLTGEMDLPILCAAPGSAAAAWLGTLTVYPEYMLPERISCLEPIDQRAWCLQELLMSPRSLVFTSTSLELMCQTATQFAGSFYYALDPQPRLPDALFLPTPSPPLDHTSRALIDKSWGMIVHEYTGRSTTEPSDRLVACAAIAEAFHRQLRPSDYLAGLWRHSLLTDLLWCVCGHHPRPIQYRAPSWSWAAVDGPVYMHGLAALHAPVAEVVRCTVSLKNSSLPFGEVTAGSIVLRTRLLQLQLTGQRDGMFVFSPSEQSLRIRWSYPEGSDVSCSSRAWYNVSWWPCCDDDTDIAGDTQARISSWAIPLVTDGVGLSGLIIARAHPDGSDSPHSKTLHRRIGFFMHLGRTSEPWCTVRRKTTESAERRMRERREAPTDLPEASVESGVQGVEVLYVLDPRQLKSSTFPYVASAYTYLSNLTSLQGDRPR
ncbi:heterokaryon incompatibility protein-domain-containing protein [Lenzites betulinus]|nr:heterokaryon incompatibility protein-domain-containing protein [Lenzites betulinus]